MGKNDTGVDFLGFLVCQNDTVGGAGLNFHILFIIEIKLKIVKIIQI